MLSTIKKYSYDAFAVTAVACYSVVQLSAIVFSPVYALPIFISSAIKTAYHAAKFFHFQKYPDSYAPQIRPEHYKDTDHNFTKNDIKALETKLEAFEHRESRDLYWTYTCKAAISLIPIYGYYALFKSKAPDTPLAPGDTWNDINALKYHIRHLKLIP